jgi:hypothetical protein
LPLPPPPDQPTHYGRTTIPIRDYDPIDDLTIGGLLFAVIAGPLSVQGSRFCIALAIIGILMFTGGRYLNWQRYQRSR